MQDKNKAVVYAAAAVMSWSTVAVMFKVTLAHFTYVEMLLVSSFSALAVFAVAVTVRKKWGAFKALTAAQWGWGAAVGLLNPVAYYLVLFKSYALLPAQVAQPINYSWPIVLLALLAIVDRKPIPKAKYVGMFLSLGGVALISLGTDVGVGGERLSVQGLLLAFLSAFLWAAYWMVNNRNRKIDTTVALFLNFLSGSVCLSVAAVFAEVDLSSVPGLLSAAYVGAFEMGIPFIFFGLAIRKTNNPALVNQLCYLSPFISLFLIHTFLGEQIHASTYGGLFLIVFGIAFNEYPARVKS
jgi:drug/metabolite transporter (DMT)-like permease